MAGKGKSARPDWGAIKAAYLAGGKPRDLSLKFGISPKAISNRASAEGWGKAREETGKKIAEELPSLVADRIAGQVADAIAERINLHRSLIADALAKVIAQGQPDAIQTVIVGGPDGPERFNLPKLNTSRDLKAWAETLAKGLEQDRTAYSILDASTVERLELERRKVELAERVAAEKHGDDDESLPGVIVTPAKELPEC